MSLKQFLLVIVLSFFSVTAICQTQQKSKNLQEFIMSCTYGVLAGTLVGAASLAFSDKPGESLNNVARGASLGLYAGIALGLFIIYSVPDPNAPYEQPQPSYTPSEEESESEYEEGGEELPPGYEYYEDESGDVYEDQGLLLIPVPLFNEQGQLHGGMAQLQVLTF